MEIQGIIEDIVYRNEENGYTVAKLYTEDDSITIVGIATFIRKDEPVLLEGDFTYHDKFGEQFKFEQIKSIMPSSVIGIKNYLGSGLIPNIGPKTADKIVDRFGDKALDIIQYYPERLLEDVIRNPEMIDTFISEVKEKYKLRTSDKINDLIDKIDMVSKFINVLR